MPCIYVRSGSRVAVTIIDRSYEPWALAPLSLGSLLTPSALRGLNRQLVDSPVNR